jgi:hypothetical protein
MRLMNEALLKRFAEVGEQDIPDPIVVAHFFNPIGAGVWYATAFDPEDNLIFGWAEVLPGCGEWGYTSIDELQSYIGPLGLGIERDLFWKEKRASKVKEIHR